MSSLITLDVGGFQLDWGKNEFFADHGILFKRENIKNVPYYYADDVVVNQPGLCRKLREIELRLELMGYSLANVEKQYNRYVNEISEEYEGQRISFADLRRAFVAVDVDKIDPFKGVPNLDLENYSNIFMYPELNKVLPLKDSVLAEYLSMDNAPLNPYLVLRLLMENSNNLDKEICWRYFDVLEGGYVTEEKLFASLENNSRFLIVTEGSTDLFIIKKSLELLAPQVADFFYFVDMTEHYPFGGTGNLYRFCEGLCSIKIANTVLVIFDNDTAGNEMYTLARRLKIPSNMRITKLPDLKEFERFKTAGPSGAGYENINQRAVSTECFLDLGYNNVDEPMVRWLAYNEKSKAYQGVLIDKERYFYIYKDLRLKEGYDFSKLKQLLEFIYEECKQLV